MDICPSGSLLKCKPNPFQNQPCLIQNNYTLRVQAWFCGERERGNGEPGGMDPRLRGDDNQ